MRRLLPIRKVAVGLVASAIYYGAHRAGLTLLDNQAADQAAQGLVGFVAAYLVPDPRVQALAKRVGLLTKLRWLLNLAEKYSIPLGAPTQPAVGEGGAPVVTLAPEPPPPAS